MPISQTTASWVATAPVNTPSAEVYALTFGAVLWTLSGATRNNRANSFSSPNDSIANRPPICPSAIGLGLPQAMLSLVARHD